MCLSFQCVLATTVSIQQSAGAAGCHLWQYAQNIAYALSKINFDVYCFNYLLS